MAGATAVAGPAVLPWSVHAQAAAEGVGPMKITKVEAVRFRADLLIQGIAPNWMWVRLHTDKGLWASANRIRATTHIAAR